MLVRTAADDDSKTNRFVGCYKTRDNRNHIVFSISATLSSCKLLAVVIGFFVILFMYSLPLGSDTQISLQRRVHELETAMSKKMSWLIKHQRRVREYLPGFGIRKGDESSLWIPQRYPDGRRHLLSPPNGVSKLAEALAPHTELAPFDDHYLCGKDSIDLEDVVVKKKIAIAAVTWKAPLSLRNSLESWKRGGLLDLVDERMLFINSPSDEDLLIAKEYDFDIYTTNEHDGNIMAGPALAYLVGNSTSDIILFMEKDFVLSVDRETTMRELYTGIQHLARGVDLYRLRGKSDWPAEGMPNCCEEPLNGAKPNCPYSSSWKSGGYFSDHMNWLYIFCDPNILESANGRVAKCTSEPSAPDSYCFTSGETNWSNNPAIFGRDWFLEKMASVAFQDWEQNNMFEFNAMMAWLSWRPPAKICVSLQGIFTHLEVDQ
jgi:hypothetical protein